MVAPSGEKATDFTSRLCALCFSALSSRDAAASTGAVKICGLKGLEGCQCRHTCIPDFDRLVIGARHDGLAVRRERHRGHRRAVCALLHSLELQGCCHKHRGRVRFGLGVRGVNADTPASQTLIVLVPPLSKMSPDALTMVFPFGEKATDSTGQSWALFFSPLSSREAVASMGVVRFG